MVLFREFFTGSIQIIQGGKFLRPVTNNGLGQRCMARKEGTGVDAVGVNLFDDWLPNLSCVSSPRLNLSVSCSLESWFHELP